MEFFQHVADFFKAIWTFLTVDLWEGIGKYIDIGIMNIRGAFLETVNAVISGLWGMVQPLFSNDTSSLESIWGGLGSDMLTFMSVLKVPESLGILSAAWVTRFIIRLVLPGIG
ncbi:MAG: DUF2523 domain-containing protein [Magnetococcales bacterium]|nr:DUF2523 domain-containing protein [Magnetococcales bacterium]